MVIECLFLDSTWVSGIRTRFLRSLGVLVVIGNLMGSVCRAER